MPKIYNKSTKELVEEFIKTFAPPPAKGFGLTKRKSLSEGGCFTRLERKSTFGLRITIQKSNKEQ